MIRFFFVYINKRIVVKTSVDKCHFNFKLKYEVVVRVKKKSLVITARVLIMIFFLSENNLSYTWHSYVI